MCGERGIIEPRIHQSCSCDRPAGGWLRDVETKRTRPGRFKKKIDYNAYLLGRLAHHPDAVAPALSVCCAATCFPSRSSNG